ncbi:hypothetical protein PsorP6_010688 [Peronosclerospora sorghi]|uniref:Uncharacterized protein n=1 Tax=Peronosclerospora sorghi TaxID=230839 RepID=A0ACC0VX95_9STRA|nr:hypothetical protein PsorP6_010688 [Peronosclerospora sorghi]
MFSSVAMDRFSKKQDPVILQYGAAKGFTGFRQEVAKFVAVLYTCSINATHPDTFMVTTGNSQAISHSAMTFSKTKKLVFVEEPTYFLNHGIFRELGLNLEGIYSRKDGIDLDSLEERLMRGDVPAFLYTIQFFHNPTGAVLSSDRCKRLVGLAQNYGFHIISDEPYKLYHINGSAVPPLASYDDSELVVSLGSFSKILAPGLCLGWAQTSEKRSKSCRQLVFFVVVVVKILSLQHSFIACVSSSQGCHVRCSAQILSGRDVYRAVWRIFFGYFVWLRLLDGIHTDLLLKEAATRHSVMFTPATRCSLYSGCDNDMRTSSRLLQWVRFSFAFYSEDEIRIGIEQFQKSLTSLK